MAVLITTAVAFSSLLTGCGSGGGSASSISSAPSSPTSDLSANVPTNTGSGAPASGCSTATFVPNYGGLIPLYRWNVNPLKVHFLNSGTITASDGSQVDLQQVALRGFNEWATAVGNAIVIQVTTNPADANVTVHFGALAGTPTPNDILGLEQSTLYSDNTIKSADVLLNTWPSMTPSNIDSFQETAAHEFGHALGLNGHSDSPKDTMYASHSINLQKGLTDRDINTLKTAYCGQFGRGAQLPIDGKTTHITNN